jgi:hypothetical protein
MAHRRRGTRVPATTVFNEACGNRSPPVSLAKPGETEHVSYLSSGVWSVGAFVGVGLGLHHFLQ